mmetsp:Transcript_5364/g.10940  ORF Transcript_5364/g.10940 Transcript_5364/m.10940 type:complete len:312 (+) Transcript_5364:74-1009(+)
MPLSDAWIDFVAGWCSGAAAVICLQPVDTVLTRWQAGLIATTTTGGGATTATATTSHVVATTMRHLTQTAGLKALWRGASPMLTAVPAQNALLMGGYGVGQAYSVAHAPEYRRTAVFVGGCTGGVLQSFLMSPVELVKVAQQCAAGEASATTTTLTTTRQILTQSLQSSTFLWRGLGATLLRDGIPHGVWFVAYEEGKTGLQYALHRPADDPVVVPLLAGAGAATAAWAVGYPADVIKTRIQAAAAASSTAPSSASLGIIATGKVLIEEANGNVWRGLYRGFGLKLVRSIPASMIGFGVYEWVKRNVLEVV